MTPAADGAPSAFRRALAAAALLGMALRLLFALGYWTGQPLTRDEHAGQETTAS